jgi:anti-sigma factor RsiW
MKRRHHQEWTARLSGYLSDELSTEEKLAVEEHLSSCDECNDALRDLAGVVAAAGALGDIEPPHDLWPGIAEAIGSNGNDPRVIAFPGSRPLKAAKPPGRVELSRRGLIAASVALIALSGTAAWFAGRATTVADVPSAAVPVESSAGVVSPVGDDPGAPAAMAGELAILEDVLTSARSVLDPNTVRVLESNLGVIEQAIADSREALAQDPGNAFLAQHLERMYRRKLVYLQDAVRLVEFGG